MTKLDSILKSRETTLPTKVCKFKAMVFPVVMYRGESWTIKRAECQRIGAFKLWCQRRLLKVPWTARRSNQPNLKEINPASGLMLKLKFQYFGHPMGRANSLEKTLMVIKIEGKRRRGQKRMKWLDSITDSMDMNLSKLSTLLQYVLFLTNCICNQIRPYFQRRPHSQILGKYIHPSIYESGKGHNPTNNTVLPCFYQYIFLISLTSYLYPQLLIGVEP